MKSLFKAQIKLGLSSLIFGSTLAMGTPIDSPTLNKYKLEYFNYLTESQVDCGGDFSTGNYICNKNEAGKRAIHGTWNSNIVPTAVKNTFPVKFKDSNLFVTAHTLFPLFHLNFEDPSLEAKRLKAIENGVNAVNIFQRKDSFSFWPELGPSLKGQVNRIGPLNLSPLLLSTQLKIVKNIQGVFQFSLFPSNVQWMEEHLDIDHPEIGMDVMFNVPNDADDTALGVATNYYLYKDTSHPKMEKYLKMVEGFAKFVDNKESRKNRRYKVYDEDCKAWYESSNPDDLFQDDSFLKECSLDDPRESWRYKAYDSKHSGAFLTWLYDERDDIYADPENGVALPGQNSVDCNVVANVLYSLSLTEKRNDPNLRKPYLNSCNAISNVILDENNKIRKTKSLRKDDDDMEISVWKYCGLFYPAHMTFPYLLSKGISEAKACQDLPEEDQKRFDQAIMSLTQELIDEQDEEFEEKASGQWYEKIDQTIALPTAMGATSLLNFYTHYKDQYILSKADLEKRVTTALENVFDLSVKSSNKSSNLPEGTFFGGGTLDEIAHWRSAPFATSIALELILKYEELTQNQNKSLKKINLLPTSHMNFIETKDRDKLQTLTQTDHESSLKLGIRNIGGSNEAVIGIVTSYGEHIKGNIQEDSEKVAFYKVKLGTELGFNFSTGAVENYNFDVKFLGVSTDTSFIIQDEIAYLPISIIRENDIDTFSTHLFYGRVEAPLIKLGDDTRINVHVAAKLFGYLQRESQNIQNNPQVQSLDLMDYSIGLSLEQYGYRAKMSFDSGIGASETSYGNRYSSHKNRDISLELSKAFGEEKRHQLSFYIKDRKNGDGEIAVDDDIIGAEYRYMVR